MNYYVYILYNRIHDKFYIGQTLNTMRRIDEHNSGLSQYTAKYKREWVLVYSEKYVSRAGAMNRERFLKK